MSAQALSPGEQILANYRRAHAAVRRAPPITVVVAPVEVPFDKGRIAPREVPLPKVVRPAWDRPLREQHPRMTDIIAAVCAEYQFSRSDLECGRRWKPLVRARQVAMYLCRLFTIKSLPEIARQFGGRDHTTVLHGVAKIAAELAERPPIILTYSMLLSDVVRRHREVLDA